MHRLLVFAIATIAASLSAAEKLEILRDEFGVPHIFAQTPAGAAFGAGYAQAGDRLGEMMRNFRKATGTMAEAFGESWLSQDYRSRLWRHREVAETNYAKLTPQARAILEGFVAGVNRYIKEHPDDNPAWAVKLEPWHIVALGRYIIYGWPEGEVAGDLQRGGIQPDPPAYRGSNEMLLAPSRTAMKAPIAVIDPHLSWYDEFRFYEIRLYGKDVAVSGASIVGLPFPALGHSRFCSVAMTTGGPDTSDVFVEEARDGKYRVGNEWRPIGRRVEKVGVKRGGRVEFRELAVEFTHHGPVVARKDGKLYTAAIPYAGEFRLIEESWAMMTARNLPEMKKALSMLQFMSQNIMTGTVDGDIYYVRNGRVPVRAKGCDPSRPMPGTGECEWQGLHRLEDLVQIANPPQGYMQNNNIAPEWMMKESPLTRDKYLPYLYNAAPGPAHQRAMMTLEQLSEASGVTAERMISIAFSPEVYKAEAWQERIRKAVPQPNDFSKMLLGWNRMSEASSRPALGFYLFKMALPDPRQVEPPSSLADSAVRDALEKAERRLKSEFAPDAVYGTLFRVGRREGRGTWPVSGGSLQAAGMATPRAIGFTRQGKEMVGHSGQTSTQIVILTRPPKSFMVLPLGNSDHKESGHYDDQAEKLFSRSQAKPTFFLDRKELEKHVTARQRLQF